MTNQKLPEDSLPPAPPPPPLPLLGNCPHQSAENSKKSVAANQSEHVTYKADLLFHLTSFTRWCLDVLSATLQRIKKSNTFRVVRGTSQPVHVLSIILVAILSAVCFPLERKQSNLLASRFTYLTYFTAFSLHVGSQFWMTFVSGLSLYFNLARHAFGDVQKILFPRYFTLNCTLSAVTAIQFARLYTFAQNNDFHTFLQLITLTLCFAVEFSIRVFLVPSVLELISSKTTIEKAAGIGQEIGHYELGPLLKCPHYMSLHRSFRKVHMYTAIGNIVAIMCSAFHLYFLAYKYTDKLVI